MKKHVLLSTMPIVAAFLTGCVTTPTQNPTQIARSIPSEGAYQTLTLDIAFSTTEVESQQTTASKMHVDYLITDRGIRTRVDTPAGPANPRPRITILDTETRSVEVYDSQTLKLDQTLSSTNLPENTFDGLGIVDFKAPFQKMTLDQFSVFARQNAFDLQDQGNGKVTINQSKASPLGSQVTNMVFDQAIGAVTENKTIVSTKEIRSTTTSTMAFDPARSTTIPTEVKTIRVLENLVKVPNVELPKPSIVLPKGQSYQLKPGEYIAQKFETPRGGGSINPNILTTESTMKYSNVESGTLKAAHFFVGGGK